MNRQEKLIKNTAILLVGMIGTKLINYFMLPLYTSWLSVEEYGIIDLFSVFISVAVPIVTLQIDQAIFRFLIDNVDKANKERTISSGLLVLMASLAVSNIVGFLIILLEPELLNPLYLLAIDLQCIYVILQQIIRGNGQNKAYSINSILLAFFNIVFSILFIRIYRKGADGYILAFCISHFIAIIHIAIKASVVSFINYRQVDLEIIRKLLYYSVPMILNNVSWWILNASNRLVLNRYCGLNANGIYAAAGKIPGIITTVYTVFHLAWQESASREGLDNNTDYYNDVYEKLLILLSYSLILLFTTLHISFKLIDSKFHESYNHIPVLLLSMFFYCIAQYYGGIFVGAKKSKVLGQTSFVLAIVNVALVFLLVKKFHIYAASISTLVSYILLSFLRKERVKRICNISFNLKDMFFMSILVLIGFCLSYLKMPFLSYAFLIVSTILYCAMFKKAIIEMSNLLKKMILKNKI